MSARVQQLGPKEYLAIVTALPENGDRDEIRTLSQLLSSRAEAREIARQLLRKMHDAVVRIEGRVTHQELDGI